LGKRVLADHGAVTSASPYASEAGLELLRQGGNAVDAAVATAFAIGVVEPQMSGIGGGGTALLWFQRERRAEYVDFYSAQNLEAFRHQPADTAPVNAGPGQDLRVVGIPGSVAGLLELLERHGTLPRATVLAPAIRLAEQGFPVNQVLAEFIRADSAKLHRFPASAAHFWPGGQPLPAGATLRNPELAAALRRVAEQGSDGFYRGETARRLVAALNRGGHPVTQADLLGFPVLWKRPLCTDYRDHVVLSAPPPQTGAQVLHTLELLEPHNLAALGLPTRSATALDVLASALRVAAADNRGNDDPRWRAVPAAGLASAEFAARRAPLVGTGRAAERIEPADPAEFAAVATAPACAALEPVAPAMILSAARAEGSAGPAIPLQPVQPAGESGGETTHISVVDAAGNAVALTQTNSSTFGVGELVSGFLLNDSGFRIDPQSTEPVPAGWRTRTSTIAPTIVLQHGRVRLIVGAPGAGRIPPAITQVISYVLDHGLEPLDAVRMPRIFPAPANTRVELEHGFPAATLGDFAALGYQPAPAAGYARVYLIARQQNRWVAVADPRHDGGAAGY
jgi:gamma-glutamyltranspeptidase/glutathione hydrolase